MGRPVDVLRLGVGAAALAAPGRLLTPAADTRWSRGFTRVLGARYVVQSSLGLVEQKPWTPPIDAAIDGLHAASMLGLAAVSPRHRRVALASAAAALAFAWLDLTEGEGTR
jgi:hypothetical protein